MYDIANQTLKLFTQYQQQKLQNDGNMLIHINNKVIVSDITNTQNLNVYMLPNGTFIKVNRNKLNSIRHYQAIHSTGQSILIKQNPLVVQIQGMYLLQFHVVTQNHALIIATSEQMPNSKLIYQWNYINGQVRVLVAKTPRHKTRQFHSKIMIFGHLQTLCICYYIDGSVQLRLMYYKYPLITNDDPPIYICQPTNNILKHQISSICQIDFSSKIAIISKHESCNKLPNKRCSDFIYLYDKQLEIKKEKAYQVYEFKFPKQTSSNDIYDFNLQQIWKPVQDVLYLKYALKANSIKTNILINKQFSQKPKSKTEIITYPVIPQKNRAKADARRQQIYQKQREYHFLWHYKENKASQIQIPHQFYKQQQINNKTIQNNFSIHFTSGMRYSYAYEIVHQHTNNTNTNVFASQQFIKMRQEYHKKMIKKMLISVEDWSTIYVQNSDIHQQQQYLILKLNELQNLRMNDLLHYDYSMSVEKVIKRAQKQQTKLASQFQVLFKVYKCRQFPYCKATKMAFIITQLIKQCDQDLLMYAISIANCKE